MFWNVGDYQGRWLVPEEQKMMLHVRPPIHVLHVTSFHLQALRKISESDEEALKYLKDLKWCIIDFVSFFMVLFSFLCSIRCLVAKGTTTSPSGSPLNPLISGSRPRSAEELSSLSIGILREGYGLSTLAQKFCELEGKVNMLLTKSCVMPNEKEELLNAAVCRVDVPEAGLISTKKALHEAPIQQ